MSLPAALAGQSMGAMAVMSPVDGILQIFNNNPYFIGIMMLVLNMGGRFISLEVTKKQEQFLQHPWVRRALIFTVLFVATRNLWVAFWATVIAVLFLGYLFNENSALCLFGDGGMSGSSCGDAPGPGEEMTPEEKEILHRLHAKAQRYQTATEGKKGKKTPEQSALDSDEDDQEVSHVDVYAANLSLLRR
jgi:hypothetical protein